MSVVPLYCGRPNTTELVVEGDLSKECIITYMYMRRLWLVV